MPIFKNNILNLKKVEKYLSSSLSRFAISKDKNSPEKKNSRNARARQQAEMVITSIKMYLIAIDLCCPLYWFKLRAVCFKLYPFFEKRKSQSCKLFII